MDKSKKELIIIGAGLAGSIILSELQKLFNVTVIVSDSQKPVKAVDYTPSLHRSYSSGLGGTTSLWHNALIEINEKDLRFNWVGEIGLDKYYPNVRDLFDMPKINFLPHHDKCTIGKPMFVPMKRQNMWFKLDCKPQKLLKGTVVKIIARDGICIGVQLETGEILKGHVFIDATGGLGCLNHLTSFLGQENKTFGYEDHLNCYVGHVRLDRKTELLFKPEAGWTVRYPIVEKIANKYSVAFYLRPTFFRRKQKIPPSQLLSNLRNGDDKLKSIFNLIKNFPELIEAATSKFGIILPLRRYEVYAVLSPPNSRGVVKLVDNKYLIDANIDENVEEYIHCCFSSFCKKMAVTESVYYGDITSRLDTGAHHSATIPFPNDEYVNNSMRLKNAKNYFVCSGAIIPESSYSNTGFTIAALSFRLIDIIKREYKL